MPGIEEKAMEQFISQQPTSEMVTFFQPLIDAIKPIFGLASAVVGGLFGLYLIFIIFRLVYERRKIKYLRDIKYDLDILNEHFNLPNSTTKKNFIAKFIENRKEKKNGKKKIVKTKVVKKRKKK